MNLGRLLKQRAAEGRPVRVGVIGAGKFSSMFLAQARTTPGLHLLALADLSVERAEKALTATGWDLQAQTAKSSRRGAQDRAHLHHRRFREANCGERA